MSLESLLQQTNDVQGLAQSLARRAGYDLSPEDELSTNFLQGLYDQAVEKQALSEQLTTWDGLKYGWSESDNFTGRLIDQYQIRQSAPPSSLRKRMSPEQQEAWGRATPDQRKAFMDAAEKRDLEQQYPVISELIQAGYDIRGRGVGNIAHEIADPIMLVVPAGRGVLGMGALAAGVGYVDSAVRQIAEEDKEVGEALMSGDALLAGAVGGVLGAGMGKVMNRTYAKLRTADPELVKAVDTPITTTAERLKIDETAEIVDTAMLYRLAGQQGSANISKKARREMLTQVAGELGIDAEDALRAVAKSDYMTATQLKPKQAQVLLQAYTDIKSAGSLANTPMGLGRKLVQQADSVLREQAPEIYGRIMRFERELLANTDRQLTAAQPIFDMLKTAKRTMGKEDWRALTQSLLNGTDEADRLIGKENRELITSFMKNHLEYLRSRGLDVGELDVYFPRTLTKGGRDQMREMLGSSTVAQKAADDWAAARNIKARRNGAYITKFDDLPEQYQAEYLNMMRMNPRMAKNKGALGQRAIDDVEYDMLDFYEDPLDSLRSYIERTSNMAEKNWVNTADKDSIGNIMARTYSQSGIGKMQDVNSMLQLRMDMGDVSPTKFMQLVRDVGYMSTLPNPFSALVQFQDLGVGRTITNVGIIDSLRHLGNVKLDELGMNRVVNNAITEVIGDGARGSQRMLDTVMKYSGFRAVDAFGKRMLASGGLLSAKQATQTADDLVKFASKWQRVYGDEFPKLVDDVRNNRMTDIVKSHLFMTITEAQPITPMQMTPAQLANPNARLFYGLKNYALKQVNMLNERVVREARKGNTAEAAKFAAKYALTIGMMGASVETIRKGLMGRELEPMDIPDHGMQALYRTLFMSPYTTGKIVEGRTTEGVAALLAPPMFGMLDATRRAATELASGEIGGEDLQNVTKYVPIVGKAAYEWFFNPYKDDDKNKTWANVFSPFDDY